MKSTIARFFASLSVLALTSPVFAQEEYTLKELGSLGGSQAEAYGINKAGFIVGTSQTPNQSTHAFIWDPNTGVMTDLGTLNDPFLSSVAYSINDNLQIVGYSDLVCNVGGPLCTRAVRWDGPVPAPVDLGTLSGPQGSYSVAYGINNVGQIVGASIPVQELLPRAFLFQGGDLIPLPFSTDRPNSLAYQINDDGFIAGEARSAQGNTGNAIRWSPPYTVFDPLPNLGGGSQGAAYGVKAGESLLVGGSEILGPTSFRRGCVFEGNLPIPLTDLPGANAHDALAINRFNEIVGRASGPDIGNRAWMFRNGETKDLNGLVNAPDWVLTHANAINDKGMIAGFGLLNGEKKAFLLTPRVDLKLSIEATPNPVPFGAIVDYNVVLVNNGPKRATGIQTNFLLPASVEILSMGGCAPTIPGGPLICAVASLLPGEVKIFPVSVRVTQSAPVVAQAEASSEQSEINEGDNQAQSIVDVSLAQFDLALAKFADHSEVFVGDRIEYSLHVNNLGPEAAQGVIVRDQLPEGVSISSISKLCQILGNGIVECSLNTLDAGASAVFEIDVIANQAGTLLNQAALEWGANQNELNPDNNESSASVDVIVPQADLVLTKTTQTPVVLIGQSVDYTITVSNAGPHDATGVRVFDPLPKGTIFLGASAPCVLSTNGDVIECDLGEMTPQSEISLQVQLGMNQTGIIGNTASVTGDRADVNPSNNVSSAFVQVNFPQVNLALTMQAELPQNPVLVGQNVQYRMTVSNNGPNTASGVQLTDFLPSEVSFLSASSNCLFANGVLECNFGAILPGLSEQVQFLVRVDQASDAVINSASVIPTGNEIEQTDIDNEASVSFSSVLPSINLSISGNASPDPVVVGESLAYQLSILNLGPQSASDTELQLNLSPGLELESSSLSCTPGPLGLICDLGEIAALESRNLNFQFRVLNPGSLESLATVSAADNLVELNPKDNVFSLLTQSNPRRVDLSVNKTVNTNPVLLGQELVYTITVSNAGPQEATGVEIRELVPEGLTLVSSSSSCLLVPDTTIDGGEQTDELSVSLVEGDQLFSCTIPDIAAQGDQALVLVFTVNGLGPFNTLTQVIAAEEESVPEDNAFELTAVSQSVGALNVSSGPNPPAVSLSVPKGALNIPMLQFSLNSQQDSENVLVQSVALIAGGTGNDAFDLQSVKLYLDGDGSGTVSEGDSLLSTSGFSSNDGVLNLALETPRTLIGGQTEVYLVSYDFNFTLASLLRSAQEGASWFVLIPLVGFVGANRRGRKWMILALLGVFVFFHAGCCPGHGSDSAVIPPASVAQSVSYQVSVNAVTANGVLSQQNASVSGIPLSGTTAVVAK